MNSNNVIHLKIAETKEPAIDSDYFGSEKTSVDILSLLEMIKQNKEKNGNS